MSPSPNKMLKFSSIKTIANTLSLHRSSIQLNRFAPKSLPKTPQISFFSALTVPRRSSATVTAGMGDDSGMDAVQRRLMFDDDYETGVSLEAASVLLRGRSKVVYISPSSEPTPKYPTFRCILVDENDNVVGHDTKYNCHLMEKIEKYNLLHRAFSVFLFNSKYELLLQQRSGTKVTFPMVWTNTCCSHPLYRESELIPENALGVRNAAQRKLLDELGIPAEDVPVDQFTPLGRMLYKAPSDGKWGEHELDYLLFIVRDVAVSPNPDEVADIKYVNQDELKELLRKADAGEDGLKLSPWFRLVVDNFLFKWWDHVQKGTLPEAIDMKTIHKLI